MRHAGSREAISTRSCVRTTLAVYFIVGRDHAGVGDYYGTYDASAHFDEFESAELGIVPMKFEQLALAPPMATTKTSPSTPAERIHLSGTKYGDVMSG